MHCVEHDNKFGLVESCIERPSFTHQRMMVIMLAQSFGGNDDRHQLIQSNRRRT